MLVCTTFEKDRILSVAHPFPYHQFSTAPPAASVSGAKVGIVSLFFRNKQHKLTRQKPANV